VRERWSRDPRQHRGWGRCRGEDEVQVEDEEKQSVVQLQALTAGQMTKLPRSMMIGQMGADPHPVPFR
jgi:hypothetical protein